VCSRGDKIGADPDSETGAELKAARDVEPVTEARGGEPATERLAAESSKPEVVWGGGRLRHRDWTLQGPEEE